MAIGHGLLVGSTVATIFGILWFWIVSWDSTSIPQDRSTIANHRLQTWIDHIQLVPMVLAILVTVCLMGWIWINRRNLGKLPITTSSVSYDHGRYGRILTWDKYSFYLHGKPTLLISGEFHYWRLPDRNRWKPMLEQYKDAGLNCIRIYFHWGFHSPNQSTYIFDGNRDLDFLLCICEDLGLFVLAAPGPYICAETQGGGFPQWLIAKRNICIRHSVVSAFRSYDSQFSTYCAEWFNAILPILARHEITTNPRGCVLAVQIENESFQLLKGIPLGLVDDMRHLAKVARQAGVTVPLFTNDGWEEGSYVAQQDNRTSFGKPTFGIDLYGFDKYVVFCPTSTPSATITGSVTNNPENWVEWSTLDVTNALDMTEKTVRNFGGGAAESPLFIPELQGGWFNHYTVKHTYDHVYNYYGETYTRLIFDSVLTQGVTAFNFYMFYGGTNWGTIGDPDVYTSYDYSACIREFGHLSGRGRQLRLAISFARCFNNLISRTEAKKDSVRFSRINIESSVSGFIAQQRQCVGPNCEVFVFFRNFTSNRSPTATVSVTVSENEPIILNVSLMYKCSFIGLGNYQVANTGIHLLLATVPIYARIRPNIDTEVWIIQCDDEINGQLAFFGNVTANGTLAPQTCQSKLATIISFQNSMGWAQITVVGSSADSTINHKSLYIVALTDRDLYTFQPHFQDHHQNSKLFVTDQNDMLPLAVTWGSYNTRLDFINRKMDLVQESKDSGVFLIASSTLKSFDGFHKLTNTESYNGTPFIYQYLHSPVMTREACTSSPTTKFINATTRQVDFNSVPWQLLATKLGNSSKPTKNTIDYGFTSGHTLYRLDVVMYRIPPNGLSLSLNFRHRGTVYINQVLIGGHLTYSLGVFRPGSKNGPDVDFGAWRSYIIPPKLLVLGINSIYVLVESLGMNRQPFLLNDIRSPRGLIGATLNDAVSHSSYLSQSMAFISWIGGGCRASQYDIKWHISGIDVQTLQDPFNHSGLADEDLDRSNVYYECEVGSKNCDKLILAKHTAGSSENHSITTGVFKSSTIHMDGLACVSWPSWFNASFDLSVAIQKLFNSFGARIPLRIHVNGPGTAYIYINSVFIARYYGNGDGPQKNFYIPEGLVKHTGNSIKMLVYSQDATPCNIDCGPTNWVQIEIRLWKIDQQSKASSLATSSGNIDENGQEFILETTTLDI
ncbi:hypothetical protein O5D80_005151 [Batrachochytrium dendrobatidis]|nr:hypothetical protein O5D80_005151 [Batrachochytrium dendrobatidis]